MQKQKPASNHLLKLKRSIPGAQKNTNPWSKKIKITPIRSIIIKLSIGTKKKLSPTTLFLLLISLQPRLLTSKSSKKVGKKAV